MGCVVQDAASTTNTLYLESLYTQYQADPSKLDASRCILHLKSYYFFCVCVCVARVWVLCGSCVGHVLPCQRIRYVCGKQCEIVWMHLI